MAFTTPPVMTSPLYKSIWLPTHIPVACGDTESAPRSKATAKISAKIVFRDTDIFYYLFQFLATERLGKNLRLQVCQLPARGRVTTTFWCVEEEEEEEDVVIIIYYKIIITRNNIAAAGLPSSLLLHSTHIVIMVESKAPL